MPRERITRRQKDVSRLLRERKQNYQNFAWPRCGQAKFSRRAANFKSLQDLKLLSGVSRNLNS